jgi:hypothetical protein
MVNDGTEPRREAPMARPLYVTLRRASELLEVPCWQMHGLSFVLETRYFGEKGGAPRVLLTSIDEFIRLRDDGEDPRAVLAARKNFQGWSPIDRRRPGSRPRSIPEPALAQILVLRTLTSSPRHGHVPRS